MPARPPSAPPDTAPAQPQGCTNLKLRQLSRLVARHYDAHVAPTGLRHTQYSLLSHVVKLGPLPAGELATVMRLTPSTLSRNLQPLIDKGWVSVSHGTDARQRVVQATDSGRAVRAEGQRAWKRAQLALNERMGPERVAALHALLDSFMSALEQPGDAEPGDMESP